MNEKSLESWGLILAAAGAGLRLGGSLPKQFLSVGGQPLYRYSLEAFLDLVDLVVVVVPRDRIQTVSEELSRTWSAERVESPTVVPGGENRQESVRLGLDALPAEIDNVLVHDAARPAVSRELILKVMEGVREQGACIPVLPVAETVKQIESGYIVKTLAREHLALAQTPQGFRLELLKEACRLARARRYLGTDDASLVEELGVSVKAVEGESANIKLTWKEDLERWLSLDRRIGGRDQS